MLSIADRRRIAARAAVDVAFRARLRADPTAAADEALGRPLPPGTAAPEVIEEGEHGHLFVLVDPAGVERELPEPVDLRGAIENRVYAALREEPALADAAVRDPEGVLERRFGLRLSGVEVRREPAGRTLLVLPRLAAPDELSDDALDFVSGGGSAPLHTARHTGSAKS